MTTTLVVGGGIAGMAVAIKLSEQGYTVDLIDIDPEWRVGGAGITITGPTLRAYKHLDMVDDIARDGAINATAAIFSFDGKFLHELNHPSIEEGLPAAGGIMRPVLHKIMQGRIRALGLNVRLGITVDALDQVGDRVRVTFSDGTIADFAMVVGADSIYSRVRRLAFPHAVRPDFTGQGCWRVSMKRPPDFYRGEFYLGHERPAGITACGPDSVYMWMLVRDDEHVRVPEDENFERLRALMEPFGGHIAWMRDNMAETDWINYRPLEAAIQPRPWQTGRIVMLGDAAHATTPHLASGAGMAVEDAIVLAQETERAGGDIPVALAAYEERRYARCEDVVTTSIEIGRQQLAGAGPEVIGGLTEAALHRLDAPF